jgi:tripartite-type tricarboxylate transporter receptor subunit TctC
MRRRQFLFVASAGLTAALPTGFITAAAAETVAGMQIRLIVPFPSGGPTDIVARPLAELLGDALKSVVVLENRAGAGGTIGAEAAARSSPDGGTLFFATVGTHAINPTLYKSLPYDAVRDFTPIALVAKAPVAIIANPALPASNLGELVSLAKGAPGKLNYGSAGIGTPGHLTAELFKIAAGIDVKHVPYKGSAPAQSDLLAGRIKIIFDPVQTTLAQVHAGKLRALAVSSKVRSLALPDVPTIAESGYPGFETTAWWGVFAPANLPSEMAASLAAQIAKVVNGDLFGDKMKPLGVNPTILTLSDFAEFQRAEISRWGKAVQDSGVTVE